MGCDKMLHLGDITKINGYAVPTVDCVIGGSPCQDLSVAGKREGLDGERSGLFTEQIRIVKEMRDNDRSIGRSGIDIRPRYMVWENVPGAFSSNKGDDFRVVLEEVARIVEEGVTIPRPPKNKWATTGVLIGDGWSIAWRVFDAQYWGVPQRRRRICLVADFNGHSAPQIVFGESRYNGVTERGSNKSSVGHLGAESRSQVQSISQSLSGYPDESGAERQNSPSDAQGGIGAGYRAGEALAYTMQDREGCAGGGKGALIQEDRSASLRTNNFQYVFQPVGCNWDGGQVSPTLTSRNASGCQRMPDKENFNCVIQPTYTIDMGGGKSACDILEDKSPTLCTTNYGEPAVVYDARGNGDGKVAPTMTEDHQNRITDYTGVVVAMDRAAYNQGKNAQYDFFAEPSDSMPTIVAKGPGAVAYAKTECYGFDQGATRDVGALFIEDCSKTITNGSCPGHHNGVVIKTVALEGNGQRESHRGDGYAVTDKSYTLNTTEVHGVAYELDEAVAVDCRNATEDTINGALQSNMAHSLNGNNVVRIKYIVRRLTPLECERLQGFPDRWTDIGEYINSKGKTTKTSDSSRYKALGNSIALPSWKWVIKRMSAQYERDATMASLFDGIGGFPLIWEQINGKGSCLWASEIEDFPIAVTKERIG